MECRFRIPDPGRDNEVAMTLIEFSWLFGILLLIIFSATIGYFIATIKERGKTQILSIKLAKKEVELNSMLKHHHEQIESLKSARDVLTGQFATLSRSALQINSRQFLRLAEQQFKQHSLSSQTLTASRQKAMDELISPLNQTLAKTRVQLQNIEKDHHASFTSLNDQINTLLRSESELQKETRNLVHALKRTDVRGRWGELSLKRIAELSGMIKHCDFVEQESIQTDKGNLIRPDMVVKMPGKKELIIDAKTPLDGFLKSLEANNETEKKNALIQHSKNFREQVRVLAAKSYWQQFSGSPDFVIMYIPGDQFLNSALEYDNDLLEDAIKSKVILATPSTLIALLRSVAYGWKQQDLTENAEKIRDQGEEIVKRMATLTNHFAQLGKSLNQSISSYNKTLGSLEKQLLPSAKKMTKLGVSARKESSALEPIETQARPVK